MRPTVSQYAQALGELFHSKKGKGEREIVEHFIQYLSRRKAKHLLPEILRKLEERANEEAGALPLKVITARELAPGDKKELAEKAKEIFPQKRLLLSEINSEVIGGAALRTTEELYDATLRAALKNFKKTVEDPPLVIRN